jgi:ADP-ribose pyrophosphatase
MKIVHQIFRGRILDVRLEEARLPNDVTVVLEMVRHPGAAAIVPVDEQLHVILVHQYRAALSDFIWEIPAGKLDANEPPESCARRELREEVGLLPGELTSLGFIYTAPGFCDEKIHLFLARQLTPTSQALGHDEVLTVERLPFEQALEMVRTGEISDAKSIAGLHRAGAILGFVGSRTSR